MRQCARALATMFALCLLNDGVWDWAWDRLEDLDVIEYRVLAAQRDPIPGTCTDDDGHEYYCPTYPPLTPDQWSLVDTVPQLPGVPPGYALCTLWDQDGPAGVVVPPVGSILYINVRAVDAAGNVGN